jgi:hypothetical protein
LERRIRNKFNEADLEVVGNGTGVMFKNAHLKVRNISLIYHFIISEAVTIESPARKVLPIQAGKEVSTSIWRGGSMRHILSLINSLGCYWKDMLFSSVLFAEA